MDYTDFGLRVKAAREVKLMTQEDLAGILGTSEAFVDHMERGECSVTLEMLVSLCAALVVTPAELLAGSLTDL